MQGGKNNLQCAEIFEFWMRVNRHTAAVVAHRQPVVRLQRDLDEAGMAGDRLVHGVVEQLRSQVMQRGFVGAADIHAGPTADWLQAFQDLDVLGGVTVKIALATKQIVHAVFSMLWPHATWRRGVRATRCLRRQEWPSIIVVCVRIELGEGSASRCPRRKARITQITQRRRLSHRLHRQEVYRRCAPEDLTSARSA